MLRTRSFGDRSGEAEADVALLGGRLGGRSWAGRGEMGTFSRTSPSGMSSPSSSSHVCSSSTSDLRSRFACQLPLLGFMGTFGSREFRDWLGLGLLCRCVSDSEAVECEGRVLELAGDKDRGSAKALRLVLRGSVIWRLVCRLGNDLLGLGRRLAEGAARFRLTIVLLGLERWPRTGEDDKRRGSGLEGLLRLTLSSPRPMSSKWPVSAMTLPSSLVADWKEDDLELLEVVMPGGDMGL